MKKFAFILFLVLAVALTLTACNQVAATARVTRWFNEEHYEFAITKANLDAESVKGYTKEYKVAGETALKDMDEIVPDNVSGTFVMDIKVTDKMCTFTTEMTLVCLYSYDVYNSLSAEKKEEFEAARVSDEEMRNTWFDEEAYGVA